MIKIPQTSEYKINNRSTIQGNILSTLNADFYTNQGKMLFSGRGLTNVTGATASMGSTALQLPVANFKYFNSKIYAVGGYGQAVTNIYYSGTVSAGSPFTQSSETSVMQKASLDNSDMAIMYSTATSNTDKLYATNDEAKVYYLPAASTTWANFSFGTANTPHLMIPFGNRMYCTDNFNTILSWDAAHTVATIGNSYTITLNTPVSSKLSISWLRVAQNRIFIGAVNTTGGRGAVYVWDGVQSGVFDKVVPLNSTGPLSCVVLNDIPYIMDGFGLLMKYNGSYFDEIGRLPLPQGLSLYNATNATNDRAVHPNGMAIINTQIHVLVSTLQDTYQPNAPSGIWCYDEDIGFYHKGSPSTYAYDGSSNYTDEGIIQYARVGALFECRSQASLTTSSTITFTAGLSAGASTGTLSSVFPGGTGMYNIYFSNGDKRIGSFTNGSTSVSWLTGGGALLSSATATFSYDVYIQGTMLYSAQPFVGGAISFATGTQTGIYLDDSQGSYEKEGFVITPEVYSNDIESAWTSFWAKYSKLTNPDTITAKYRTVVDVPTPALVTWTGAGTCTTTQNVSAYSAGDEMFILTGNNAGISGNITSLTSNTAGGVTTYTIAVNNPTDLTSLSGTSRTVFQKWKLIEWFRQGTTNFNPTLPISQDQYFTQGLPNIESSTNPGNADTKIQFKIICRWAANNNDRALEQIIATDFPQVKAT